MQSIGEFAQILVVLHN